MTVNRNRVQEILKKNQAAIQQATFLLQGGADAPVEVTDANLAPIDLVSLANDLRVSDDQFYAIVDRDIKQYGYFQGDQNYNEGGRVMDDNVILFDEMFGPDRPGFDKPVTDLKDVMPTVIGPNNQTRRVGSLWEVPEDLTDPRDEFKQDSAYWVQLLRLLYAVDGDSPQGLFGLMYGLRCEGAVGLEPNPKGGVKVFPRDERLWSRARAEIMGSKDMTKNLNTLLGQVVV